MIFSESRYPIFRIMLYPEAGSRCKNATKTPDEGRRAASPASFDFPEGDVTDARPL
jgi:hypothetical protein